MKIIHYNYPNRGYRIEAGIAGTLESNCILVRMLAAQLLSQGYNIQEMVLANGDKVTTFEHELDKLQVMLPVHDDNGKEI